ncbi:hypothetical protein [Polaromonas sp.]|uniref:hypothetical protein n=1 Tax=Polaromonas sp. TaxID=1869339 RepID=UPI00352A0914
MVKVVRSVTLYKTEGSADKVYGLSIEEAEDTAGLYLLMYMNGRRGSTMRKNRKLEMPVTLDVATAEFNKVEKAKMKDGYTPAQSGQVYTSTPDAGRVSGVRPMLPADLPKGHQAHALKTLLANPDMGMQEKIYGENRGLSITQEGVKGINKNGLYTDIPACWSEQLTGMAPAVLFGEQVGDVFHAFDMIEMNGVNHRATPYISRHALLEQKLLGLNSPNIRLVHMTVGSHQKSARLKEIDAANGEGVVFKRLDAPFEAGKNSNSYRHKFREGMTCFVLACNVQRSVAVGATDPATGKMVSLGNVTIPANHQVPKVNDLVEVAYLYRHEDGGLMEPTYEGPRSDVSPETVTIAQITRIKLKNQPIDTSDGSLSQQALAALAKSELEINLKTIAPFVPKQQLQLIKEGTRGEEATFFLEMVQDLAQRIRTMPQTGETDGLGQAAIIQLRYFWGGSAESLIVEKDKGSMADATPCEQHQAYGSVDLGNGGGHEAGYVSIVDMISENVELDLYFTPKSMEEHFRQEQHTMSESPATA